MTKVKLKQHSSRELVTDPEWEVGMEVSVKFIAKKLAKMNCGAAMAESNFGMPAAEHFVYGAFDKLYTGVWEWNPHCAVHTQIIKIALSDIHHYLDSWNNSDEHPQMVEIDERLANHLTDDMDFMDVVYDIAERAADGDPDLLNYLKAMRRCDDYELIAEEMGVEVRIVYQLQRKLMRRLEKRRAK